MKYFITRVLALCVFTVSCAVVVHASGIGKTYTLYTVPGFVDALIARGIIPEAAAGKARTLMRMVLQSEEQANPQPTGALNADKVRVTVSQLIEQSDLTFDARMDIKGPILLVKNTTKEKITLEAKRHCQVVYRIYDTKDVLLYDSATSKKCTTDEKVTYPLDAEQTRMFGIMHRTSDYALTSGSYRFHIEYPGYGEGDLTVRIK
jgi:hypothetical protein